MTFTTVRRNGLILLALKSLRASAFAHFLICKYFQLTMKTGDYVETNKVGHLHD
jgi:hypothetical protein